MKRHKRSSSSESVRVCISGVIGIICILCVVCCRGVQTVVEVPLHDTTYIRQVDSVLTVDTFWTERETIIREADSGLLSEYGLKLREGERAIVVLRRELERRVSLADSKQSDTVVCYQEKPMPYRVTEYVEKELKWWQKGLMWVGVAGVTVFALWLVRKVASHKKTR